MRHSFSLIPMLLATLAACGQQDASRTAAAVPALPVAPVLADADARDIHSHAEPAVARVTHVDLDLVADFAARTLAGTATLDVLAPGANPVLTLDTDRLAIEAVTDESGAPLPWKLGDPDTVLGTPLVVTLGTARRVQVNYRTSPEAEALQWLSPAQTAGGEQPYLFTQGEAILTRSWIPTQDSPGIRQTWTARIVAPAALTVVMSAEMRGAEALQVAGGRAWLFRMDEPVAPYLIAMAIGNLEFRAVGTRTGIYTEPSRLDAAASEFADLEQLVSAAESLYGSYRWGRYDVLVLPPSFPFGGMENPRLTFATPTIIAGDKSLVSVIAHELAHSWSGNLVSNATWADFWLNEGFTNYFENRIMERVYGERAAQMLADLGWDDLQAAIREAGGLKAADTRLHQDLSGRDPDIGMTDIAYEKGATFLRTIEKAVGRERWDVYLRDYFDRYAFQPQTSARFLADLRQHLIQGDAELEKALQLDEWVYAPGLPANAVHIKAEAFTEVDAAAKAFVARGTLPEVAAWGTSERVRFLTRLPRRQTPGQLEAVVKLLQLETQHNSEILFAWLRLAVANRYAPAVPQLEQFLLSQGRRKFVLPLFTDLMAQGGWGRNHALRIYAQARPGYHSVTSGSVDKIVPLAAAGG